MNYVFWFGFEGSHLLLENWQTIKVILYTGLRLVIQVLFAFCQRSIKANV